MDKSEYQKLTGILDRMPLDVEQLGIADVAVLLGYTGLKVRSIMKLLHKGHAFVIPSTTVVNGSLAVRLNGQNLVYGSTSVLCTEGSLEAARLWAREHWGDKLIKPETVTDVCTLYLMDVTDMRLVGQGYVGTNACLSWLNQKKDMSPAKLDERINFATGKSYSYIELRSAKLDKDVINASFNVALYCSDCGRHISRLSEACGCGGQFKYDPSDFEICLSCREGPFDFDLTPKMRQVFERQGHVFRYPIQGN